MSALLARPPVLAEPKLRALFYGESGSGKTFCATQFPKPYYIDTESATRYEQYIDNLNATGGMVLNTYDFQEIYNQVSALAREKHDFKTLVIDSLTWVYGGLLRTCAAKVGDAHGRHYGEADKQMKMLIDLILRLDMNVVLTTHVKDVRDASGGVSGLTFDGYKKLDYLFDLVLETKKAGPNRFAVIKKSRIKAFAELDKIEFNYEEIAKRIKFDAPAHIAEPIVTQETLDKLKSVIEEQIVSIELQQRWLAKAQVLSLDQLTEKQAIAIIGFYNKAQE